MKSQLTEIDIQAGKTYRAKRFREFPFGGNNDRHILYISPNRTQVQYNSDTVRIGHYYPRVTIEQFLKWVKEEIIDN